MAHGSTSRSTDRADVVVGVVRAPHGVRGEVRVEPTTDRFDERFRAGARFGTDLGPLTIASVRGSAAAPIVLFEGVADRRAAEALRGRELRVAREEARRGEGHLWADLIGMEVVTPDGARLGAVSDVLRAGGADVLVVRGDREILLPALGSVIREVDVERGRIVAVPQEEVE